MIEKCLICDHCGGILAAGRSPQALRKEADSKRIGGKDVCKSCQSNMRVEKL